MGGFKVGFENSLFQIAMTDKTTGIDIDGRHRFGLINNQIATRFQFDPTRHGPVDLILNTEQVKDRTFTSCKTQPDHPGGEPACAQIY